MACIPVLSFADAVWVQCVQFSFQLVVHERHRWAVLTKVKLCRVTLRIVILCVADLVEHSVVVCDCIVQAVESWRELDQIGRVFFDDNLKHLDSWKPKAIANYVLQQDMLTNQQVRYTWYVWYVWSDLRVWFVCNQKQLLTMC